MQHTTTVTAVRFIMEVSLRSCRKPGELLEAGKDGAAGALAASDDEHGVVPRDGADDFVPPRGIEGEPECLRSAGGGLHDEQRAHAVDRDEQRREELLEVRPDGGAALERRRVMRPAVRGRDLGEPQLTDVAR